MEGVYIGRPTKFGNPFYITETASREEVVLKFYDFIYANPELLEAAKKELKGKNLYCSCSPELCHGHILLSIANDIPLNDILKGVYNGFSF